jgi:hypothetical protein
VVEHLQFKQVEQADQVQQEHCNLQAAGAELVKVLIMLGGQVGLLI